MNRIILVVFALILLSASPVWGSNDHGHDDKHEGAVVVSADMAKKNGIATATAQGGNIEKRLLVYGRLQASPEHYARIRARFPGLVRSVNVNLGDVVKKGDTLAVIESNDSLQTYQLKAPIDGMIQSRMVNIGEITGEEPLFELFNNRVLWAELKVFHTQREQVKVGAKVHIVDEDREILGKISHIIPGPFGEPYVIARVAFDNSDGNHQPGDLVSAEIAIDSAEVSLRVEKRAIQQLRGWQVVFIKIGDTYEIRPLTLGRQDGEFAEVLSGLNVGDNYVVQNSYLLKADIEKSGAAHDH